MCVCKIVWIFKKSEDFPTEQLDIFARTSANNVESVEDFKVEKY